MIDAVFEEIPEESIEREKNMPESKEVLCGVVLRRCPVVSYNPFSNVLVYDKDGQLIQTNDIVYDGSGFVEVE